MSSIKLDLLIPIQQSTVKKSKRKSTMAATRSFTLLLIALVAAMATAFVPGNVVSRSSGEF